MAEQVILFPQEDREDGPYPEKEGKLIEAGTFVSETIPTLAKRVAELTSLQEAYRLTVKSFEDRIKLLMTGLADLKRVGEKNEMKKREKIEALYEQDLETAKEGLKQAVDNLKTIETEMAQAQSRLSRFRKYASSQKQEAA